MIPQTKDYGQKRTKHGWCRFQRQASGLEAAILEGQRDFLVARIRGQGAHSPVGNLRPSLPGRFEKHRSGLRSLEIRYAEPTPVSPLHSSYPSIRSTTNAKPPSPPPPLQFTALAESQPRQLPVEKHHL